MITKIHTTIVNSSRLLLSVFLLDVFVLLLVCFPFLLFFLGGGDVVGLVFASTVGE